MVKHQIKRNEVAKIFTPKLRSRRYFVRYGQTKKSTDVIAKFKAGFEDFMNASWNVSAPTFSKVGSLVRKQINAKSTSPNLLNAWVDWRHPPTRGYIPLLGIIIWGKGSVVKQSLQKCLSLAKEYF